MNYKSDCRKIGFSIYCIRWVSLWIAVIHASVWLQISYSWPCSVVPPVEPRPCWAPKLGRLVLRWDPQSKFIVDKSTVTSSVCQGNCICPCPVLVSQNQLAPPSCKYCFQTISFHWSTCGAWWERSFAVYYCHHLLYMFDWSVALFICRNHFSNVISNNVSLLFLSNEQEISLCSTHTEQNQAS